MQTQYLENVNILINGVDTYHNNIYFNFLRHNTLLAKFFSELLIKA